MRKTDVISHFKTAAAVAVALGITPEAVIQWGDVIPRGRAFELAALTGGALSVDLSLYEKSSGPTAAA